MRTLKDATNDIKGEIQKSADKNGIDTSISKDVKEEISKAKDEINDLTGSIRRNL
jgi:sec-independent protein translocase protein TatA